MRTDTKPISSYDTERLYVFLFGLALTLVLILLLAPTGFAQDTHTSTNGGGDWYTAATWSNNAVPESYDAVTITTPLQLISLPGPGLPPAACKNRFPAAPQVPDR